jgi:hypothetical protein
LGAARIASDGGKLALMVDERRREPRRDRRARPRSGRRNGDERKPWYMRRRLWLAAASMAFVGWRRLRTMGRTPTAQG